MKATARVPGLRAISSPTSGPGAGDEVDHARAAGPPRPCTRPARRAQIAVVGAGVHTTVLPAASAGASSSAGIVYGQFQGVMIPTAPRARRTSITRLPARERVRQLAAEALGVLGRHPPVLDQLVDLVVGLRAQRLALVERERARQLVAAALDHVADRVHLRRPLERGQPRPALERPVGGVDRPLRRRRGRPAARCRAPRRWPGSWSRRSRRTRPAPHSPSTNMLWVFVCVELTTSAPPAARSRGRRP